MFRHYFFLIALILIGQESFSQFAFLSKNNLPKDTLGWDREVAELDDLYDIIRFVDSHEDEYKMHSNEMPIGYPLSGETDVSSHFGMRKHPVHHTNKFHKGIDLAGKTGDNVYCTGDGVVQSLGYDASLGNFITVKHPNGFVSIYGHLSKILVKNGSRIQSRQLIGKVGATGTVTGPHLHYTIKKNGIILDPFELIYLKK